MENLLNINQAAFILKVHPLTIRRYIKEGKLKAIRVGGNVRVKESSLLEFQKDFSSASSPIHEVKNRFTPAKTFNLDDPLLRLKGRGASLNLSS